MPPSTPHRLLTKRIWRRDFQGSPSELMATEKWLAGIAREQGFPSRVAFAVQICAEELLTNVMKYSGKPAPSIEVTLAIGGDVVELAVEDDGQPFDVATSPSRTLGGSLAETEPGGLGIRLIRSFAAGLSYQRNGASNKVRATFQLTEITDTQRA